MTREQAMELDRICGLKNPGVTVIYSQEGVTLTQLTGKLGLMEAGDLWNVWKNPDMAFIAITDRVRILIENGQRVIEVYLSGKICTNKRLLELAPLIAERRRPFEQREKERKEKERRERGGTK